MLAWQEAALGGNIGEGMCQPPLRGFSGSNLFQIQGPVLVMSSVSPHDSVTQEAGPWPRSGQRCWASLWALSNLTAPGVAWALPWDEKTINSPSQKSLRPKRPLLYTLEERLVSLGLRNLFQKPVGKYLICSFPASLVRGRRCLWILAFSLPSLQSLQLTQSW